MCGCHVNQAFNSLDAFPRNFSVWARRILKILFSLFFFNLDYVFQLTRVKKMKRVERRKTVPTRTMSQKEDKIVPGSGPIRPTQCNTSKHRFTHPNTPSGSVLSKDTERTPLLVPLGKTPFQPAPNLPLLVPVQPQGNMVKPSPNSTAL